MQKSEQPAVLIHLTDEQIDKIADRAVEKLDARIGRSVRKRAILILGLVGGALISAVITGLFGK